MEVVLASAKLTVMMLGAVLGGWASLRCYYIIYSQLYTHKLCRIRWSLMLKPLFRAIITVMLAIANIMDTSSLRHCTLCVCVFISGQRYFVVLFYPLLIPTARIHPSLSWITGNMISASLTHTHTYTYSLSLILCAGVNRCSSHMAVWTPDLKQPQRSRGKCHSLETSNTKCTAVILKICSTMKYRGIF